MKAFLQKLYRATLVKLYNGFVKKAWNSFLRKSRRGKIVTAVSSLILVFLVIATAVLAVGVVSGHRLFPRSPVWVISGSMEPTVPAKSYILVEYLSEPSDIQVGDVIMFTSPDPRLSGAANTHRVFGIDQEGRFITKGDAALSPDDYPVPPENVLARYVRNMPLLTFFGRLFSSFAGAASVIFLLLGVTGLVMYGYVEKETARRRKERMDTLVALEVARLEAEGTKKEKE